MNPKDPVALVYPETKRDHGSMIVMLGLIGGILSSLWISLWWIWPIIFMIAIAFFLQSKNTKWLEIKQSELELMAKETAQKLRQRGIKRGTRVLLMIKPTDHQLPVFMLALVRYLEG